MNSTSIYSTTPAGLSRSGAGEPLLLVHGFTLTWHCWGGVIDSLSSEFDILAPTLPFHWGGPAGDRPLTVAAGADHLEALMDETGWETAHIAGHSLGGWLALELARRGRARSVTAVASAGLWQRGSRHAERLRRKFQVMSYLAPMSRGFSNPTLAAIGKATTMRAMCHRPGRVAPDLASIALQSAGHCTARDINAIWPTDTALEIIDQITPPVTIVFSARDRVIPPSRYGAQLVTPTANRRVCMLTDVGHVPMLEVPSKVATEIRRTATVN
ncbi:alpha/beta fold hydrolase [Nocardia sp. BSTN01]|uniref:alpha/beta fold hydrolase n=1 Tax=Nocardia sp. BSTN01 TaxID=2783665 RepID=UPI00188FDC57|nr:alpha/beta fold hydrolase [Nocardia sp. BSTN01]MBF4996825.1 alpha/beta fold hydrolase [Nocardia sp. BSTN01]